MKNYGVATCKEKIASVEDVMPRGKSKICPDSFLMNYMKTFEIEEEGVAFRKEMDSPPSLRPRKNVPLWFKGVMQRTIHGMSHCLNPQILWRVDAYRDERKRTTTEKVRIIL